jgi:hypothetical protein
MLPRFVRLEAEFERAIQRLIKRTAKGSGVLSQIKSHVIHEGKEMSIVRAEEDQDTTDLRAEQAEVIMTHDEIDNVNLEFIMFKANEIATQFEKQLSVRLFETVKDVTDRTGQSLNAHGQPLTVETLLQLFDKMQINFERNKEVGDFTIVVAPAMIPALKEIETEMMSNPELRKKWNDLIESKRNEFREREINRNLVG